MLKRYTAALLCAALALTSALSPVFAATTIVGSGYFTQAGTSARYFDASNDYGYHNTATNFTNSKEFTMSFWFKRAGGIGSLKVPFLFGFDTNAGFFVNFLAGNTVRFGARNSPSSSATLNLDVTGSTAISDTTTWHHCMVSIDLSNTGKRHFYIDGAAETPTWTTYTNSTIDFTSTATNAYVMGSFASLFTDASFSEVWFNEGTGAYIDLSVQANREIFRNADGSPNYLGENGEAAIGGTTPLIYLPNGNPADNKGSTANFAIAGSLDTVDGPNP